jgi:hypothetical protein
VTPGRRNAVCWRRCCNSAAGRHATERPWLHRHLALPAFFFSFLRKHDFVSVLRQFQRIASHFVFFTFSLWASVFSTTQRGERRWQYQHSQETSSIHNIFFDYLEPDAQAVRSNDSSTGFGNVRTDFGRINIRFSSDGSVIENIHQSVTDNEVFLRIRLIFGDALTLYAVRRFKIESHDTHAATRLTPMQPSSLRSEIAVDGFFVGKPRPVDFSCTELDLSSIPNGAPHVLSLFLAHTRTRNTRAVDCCVFWRLRQGLQCNALSLP